MTTTVVFLPQVDDQWNPLPHWSKRFWSKVDVRGPDECWPWTARTNSDGYGLFTMVRIGDRQWTRVAYRIAYEMVNGPVPEGLELDHTCHDPIICDPKACQHRRCANPRHMEAVTHLENCLRGGTRLAVAALRAFSTHCHRGHLFDEQNTYVNPKTGNRDCRKCRSDMLREKRHAAKAVAW